MIDPGNGPVAAPQGHPLSPRETQVLEMASSGLTNAQIAAELAVSVHVVKFHLAGIYRKLEVANRTEAAVKYLRWLRSEGR
jgi:DNA-binding CsgD family transcriptional regulator